MNARPETRRRFAVAAGFALFIAISLAAAYLLGLLPTFEEKCVRQCKASGKNGQMEYIFSAGQTAGMRGRGPKECKCYPSGTYGPPPN